MRHRIGKLRKKSLGYLCGAGMLLIGGGCDLGNITTTTTVTLDARDALRQIINGAVLGPVDNFLTTRIDQLLGFEQNN